MERVVRITAVPAEEAHPDHVVAAIEANVARVDGAETLAHWVDACAGAGAAELVIRVDIALPTARTASSIEAALVDELSRRGLRATVTVDVVGRDAAELLESSSESGPSGADRLPRNAPTPLVLRDDVRRLVHLIPTGRVTTVTTIAEWVTSDSWRVALTIDALAGEHRLPWHRVTDHGGQLDTLRDGVRLRTQSARLEAERVPVRHARVIGFDHYFIDAARLCGARIREATPDDLTGTT